MGKYVVTQTFRGLEEGKIFEAGALVEFTEERANAINAAICGGALQPLDEASPDKEVKDAPAKKPRAKKD